MLFVLQVQLAFQLLFKITEGIVTCETVHVINVTFKKCMKKNSVGADMYKNKKKIEIQTLASEAST